ncbi:MAG: hypothetical protein KDK12_17960 [Rhodobacteraceae bacterium]|nr:hypothetical protein [Paracoccaceae bacterium]
MRVVLATWLLSLAVTGPAECQTMPPSEHYDSTGRFAGTYRCTPTAITAIEIDPDTGRFVARTYSTTDTRLTLHVAEVGLEDFGSMANAVVISLDLADQYPGSAMRYAITIEIDALPGFSCFRDEGYMGRIPQTGQLTCESPMFRYEFSLNSMTYLTTFYEPGSVDRSTVRRGAMPLSYSMAGECQRESVSDRRVLPRPRPADLAPPAGAD